MSPGEVDPRVVRRHLAALRRVVASLCRRRGVTVGQLEADDDARWSVERALQLAAQNVLDIATHIAAGTGHDVPDYATAMALLGTVGALPEALSRELQPLAGFRNVLVHGYLEVDLERVHWILEEKLDDFEAFAGAIERFLEGR